MPTASHPKKRPPSRNDERPAEDAAGAPNEGALPPGAAATGGASGDRPRPGGTADPGKKSGGGAGGAGAGAGAVGAGAITGATAAVVVGASARAAPAARRSAIVISDSQPASG